MYMSGIEQGPSALIFIVFTRNVHLVQPRLVASQFVHLIQFVSLGAMTKPLPKDSFLNTTGKI